MPSIRSFPVRACSVVPASICPTMPPRSRLHRSPTPPHRVRHRQPPRTFPSFPLPSRIGHGRTWPRTCSDPIGTRGRPRALLGWGQSGGNRGGTGGDVPIPTGRVGSKNHPESQPGTQGGGWEPPCLTPSRPRTRTEGDRGEEERPSCGKTSTERRAEGGRHDASPWACTQGEDAQRKRTGVLGSCSTGDGKTGRRAVQSRRGEDHDGATRTVRWTSRIDPRMHPCSFVDRRGTDRSNPPRSPHLPRSSSGSAGSPPASSPRSAVGGSEETTECASRSFHRTGSTFACLRDGRIRIVEGKGAIGTLASKRGRTRRIVQRDRERLLHLLRPDRRRDAKETTTPKPLPHEEPGRGSSAGWSESHRVPSSIDGPRRKESDSPAVRPTTSNVGSGHEQDALQA